MNHRFSSIGSFVQRISEESAENAEQGNRIGRAAKSGVFRREKEVK